MDATEIIGSPEHFDALRQAFATGDLDGVAGELHAAGRRRATARAAAVRALRRPGEDGRGGES